MFDFMIPPYSTTTPSSSLSHLCTPTTHTHTNSTAYGSHRMNCVAGRSWATMMST